MIATLSALRGTGSPDKGERLAFGPASLYGAAMRSICWLALMTPLFVLPGCSSSSIPPWLQGDWIFDMDASEKAAIETANAQSHHGVFGRIYTPFLSTFSITELRITDKEVTVTGTGDGKTDTYEVVSSVPDRECLLKQSNGTLVTYYKAGDSIWAYSDWGPKIKPFLQEKVVERVRAGSRFRLPRKPLLPTPELLAVEADFFVVAKPPHVLSHPTRPDGKPSLLGWLQEKFPGEFVALVNRPDRETSGTVLGGALAWRRRRAWVR